MLSRKKKILITGANGQLGMALAEIAKTLEANCVFLSRQELDITSQEEVESVIKTHNPSVIINTAAYTAVDAAEEDKEEAFNINGRAVKNLVEVCRLLDIALIHISTDYVFDGSKEGTYVEDDKPNPKTVYGVSKLAGEQEIINSDLLRYAIIRTSWVYSIYGSNFVKTMLKLSQERSELSIVDDQLGCPTWANDLARALFVIAEELDSQNSGIYHFSNRGEITWHTFANAIFKNSDIEMSLKPVSSEAFPRLAERPKNSVLNTGKLSNTFGVEIPLWEDSLKLMLNSL